MTAASPLSHPGKVALVTGAGSGIGRASALAFAQAGAQVVVSDVDEPGGTETVRQIVTMGGDARFVRCDVTREDEVMALIQTAMAISGRLDWCHNNAGIGWRSRVGDEAKADWDRVLAVNLTGVWLCLKHELLAMSATGGGAIVNTASVAGLFGMEEPSPAYVASKHGGYWLEPEGCTGVRSGQDPSQCGLSRLDAHSAHRGVAYRS